MAPHWLDVKLPLFDVSALADASHLTTFIQVPLISLRTGHPS